ncbi:hypothetical protein Cob_v009362 [Colletotrichum orbiculare MAFF 240422]|uniref:Uncharacterized protein n=1 Tax=Colletotrichum orbiculare (strain 104-T / ATCC 96160 / CBS 514.97 / LARS 414 / MAFF 240422) TaxID=1213857 RepID=A0A484FLK6_COLOR|nr:hypothetical protein Cob_v009362 [Colletotrichum orbiculare MAFF 240422]
MTPSDPQEPRGGRSTPFPSPTSHKRGRYPNKRSRRSSLRRQGKPSTLQESRDNTDIQRFHSFTSAKRDLQPVMQRHILFNSLK